MFLGDTYGTSDDTVQIRSFNDNELLTPYDLQPTFEHASSRVIPGYPAPLQSKSNQQDHLKSPSSAMQPFCRPPDGGMSPLLHFSAYLVCCELCSLFWNMWFSPSLYFFFFVGLPDVA